MNKVWIGVRLSESDRAKAQSLVKFIWGNSHESIVLVGSLASRYWIALAGHESALPERALTNVDVVVRNLNVIEPTVLSRFLVGFKKRMEYMSFLDIPSRIKVHVFTSFYPPRNRCVVIDSRGLRLMVASREWLFARTLVDLKRVLTGDIPVDPYQFQTAKLLLSISEKSLIDEIWREAFVSEAGYPSWEELWRLVLRFESTPRVQEYPFHLGKGTSYSQALWWLLKWGGYTLIKRLSRARNW